jgi:hypothetical protein
MAKLGYYVGIVLGGIDIVEMEDTRGKGELFEGCYLML